MSSPETPESPDPHDPAGSPDTTSPPAPADAGPRGHALWTSKGMAGAAAVIGVVALVLTMAWTGRPAPEAEEEGPAEVHMGAQMDLVEAYAPRFNDAQAFAAPMPEGEWDGNGWLFVANEVGRGVSVYDIQTQQPVEFVYSPDSPVPHHPYVSPDQRWVAADARFGNETFLIDTENDFATTFLEFPETETNVAGPLHGTWTADSTRFLVALQRSGRLGVVDVTGDEPVIAEVIDLETRPRDVYITPDDERAFVTMQRSNKIAVVELDTWEVRYIDRGGADGGADYTEDGSGSGGGMSTDGSLFAVSNTLDDEVVIIDTATEEIVHTVAGVPSPVNAEFLGTTHIVGTGNRSDGSATFIDADTGELLKTVATGGGANIPYLGPDGNIWVTHNGDHHLSVLDAETYEIIDEVEVGVNPHWMFFTPYGSRAFVSNWGEASVSIVDVANRQEIGRIDTALNPNGMAIKSDVTEAEAERALARAEEEGVAEQIAAASEMILPEPRDEAEQVFLNTCTQCHDLGRIVRNNAKGEQWAAIVERMKGNGAQMTAEEQQLIVDYLIDGRHQDLEFGTRYDEEFADG